MKKHALGAVLLLGALTTGCADLPEAPPQTVARPGQAPRFDMAPFSNPYGVNVGGFYNANSVALARLDSIPGMMRAAGAGWVRIGFPWSYIQSMAKWGYGCDTGGESRNQEIWDWTATDTTVARAERAGLNVLGALGLYTPEDESQVCGTNHQLYNPKEWVAWEAFVAAAVARYPSIKAWEIWNEPNAPTGHYLGCVWPYCPVGTSRAQAYADLVIHAAQFIHADGDLVVAPGAADMDPLPTAEFIAAVMAIAGDSINLISFHTYGASISGMSSAVAAASDTIDVRDFWVTEAGYANATPTEVQLQNDVTARFTSLPARVKTVFYWHAFWDYNWFSEAPAEVEDRHLISGYGTGGLLRTPAWHTLKAIAAPEAALTVTVSGISTIHVPNNYTWTCGASGGSGGYTYQWERKYQETAYEFVGSGSSYTEYVDASNAPTIHLRCSATSGTRTTMKVKNVAIAMF